MREREQHDAADEEQHLPRQLGDPGAHQRLEHGEVGGEAARQLAGAALGEEAGRQPHQMREHVLAQLRDHPLRRAGEQVDLHEVHRALQREGEHEPDRDAVEQGAVALLERGVEQVAHDVREREADRGGDDEAHGAHGEPCPRTAGCAAAARRAGASETGRPRPRACAPRRGIGWRAGHVSVSDCPRRAARAAPRRATGSSSVPPRSDPRATAGAPSRAPRARSAARSSRRADQTRTCTTPSAPGAPMSSSVSGAFAPGAEQQRQLPRAARRRRLGRSSAACGRSRDRPVEDHRARTAARDRAARTCTPTTPASRIAGARITRTTPTSSHAAEQRRR